MTEGVLAIVIVIVVLGAGLVAGIFFAFSAFIMKALGRIPMAHGISAMQSINVVVINPWFMTVFFGTAVVCLILAIFSLLHWHNSGAGYVLVGSMAYLLGTILVTIAFNVPRNNALSAVDPSSDEGGRIWTNYLRSWTFWNHVRTAAALASAAAFCITLL